MKECLGIGLKDVLKINEDEIENIKKETSFNEVKSSDIAIIGIAGKFPNADDVYEFWENIKQGKDCITNFPESRKADTDEILKHCMNKNITEDLYDVGAYFDRIDEFDYSFFRLSPNEARLMDPYQRLFLQTAWQSIEDAGYEGSTLSGSNTGVFLGYSCDFGKEYEELIDKAEPDSVALSIPGNIKSIIASRIAYCLDLKGPAIVVDTACSSALVSVHLACQSIKNGECDMALAGAVKINLIPLKEDRKKGIGVQSSDGKAKSFDDFSDGTGLGEGVAVLVLKSLNKAMRDRDNIYAIIKGSAINQDGSSIGITAPNPLAQKDVIIKAWENANINPETISYIEAHGTGTKLGDPIEIEGLDLAFKAYTDKKQFCAIGSIKTNIGHLDNAAGIAGLVKLVMSLKYSKIPPTLHFKRPNRVIGFDNSAVYINDKLVDWKPNGTLKRCGISAFGLSGTNCHMVLEEAPKLKQNEIGANDSGPFVLACSAKSMESLRGLIKEYRKYFTRNQNINLNSLCYTANACRNHFDYRLALIFEDEADIQSKLDIIEENWFDLTSANSIFIGEKVIKSNLGIENNKGTTDSRSNSNFEMPIGDAEEGHDFLQQICREYTLEANIDWDKLYQGKNVSRISIPVYTFDKKRCWLKISKDGEKNQKEHNITIKEINHPLIDRCLVKTLNQEIYSTIFKVDGFWVLHEHKVNNMYVAPGTTYLEMIRKIFSLRNNNGAMTFKDIVFLKPLIINIDEEREVHILLTDMDQFTEFKVISRYSNCDDWTIHAEGKVHSIKHKSSEKYLDVANLMLKLEHIETLEPDNMASQEFNPEGISTGPRWNNIRKLLYGDREVLALIDLPQEFNKDLELFGLHPALMDCAVNLCINDIGEGLYLPFSYKQLHIYGNLPQRFISKTIRKQGRRENAESETFDVILLNEEGKVLVEIYDYTIKRVREIGMEDNQYRKANRYFNCINWVEEKSDYTDIVALDGDILVFKDDNVLSSSLAELLKHICNNVIEVEYGTSYQKVNDQEYIIGSQEDDYKKLFADIGRFSVSNLFYISSTNQKETSLLDFNGECLSIELDRLFYLSKLLTQSGMRNKISFTILYETANSVTGDERNINPLGMALFGFGTVLSKECPNLELRCIDYDEETVASDILKLVKRKCPGYTLALRKGRAYRQEFGKLDIENAEVRNISFKNNGAYIITGGTGGLGIEMARYIASKANTNICLINRKEFPSRDRWDSIIKENIDIKSINSIQKLVEIENSGSTVSFYQANVSNIHEMKPVFDDIRNTLGRINGIIHAAGVAGDGFIINKSKTKFDDVVKPKIKGSYVIDCLTKEDNIDFLILFSSVSAILADAGQSDYTAANAFLDAFSFYRNKRGKFTLTVNWPAWKETGMAVDFGVNEIIDVFMPIHTYDAVQALDTIINRRIEQVIVGELALERKTENGDLYFPIKLSESIIASVRSNRQSSNTQGARGLSEQTSSIVLKGKKDNDYTDTELELAKIWASILGYEEINIFDDFYSLGGDSIFALRITNSVNEHQLRNITIGDVFRFLTVAKLANFLDEEAGAVTEVDVTSKNSSDNTGLIERYQLSSAQKRIWFLQKYDTQMAVYNLPLVSYFEFELDVEKLCEALNILINRHSSLRTVFVESNGIPEQYIIQNVDVKVDYLDLSDKDDKDSLVEGIIHQDKLIPFQLSVYPLMGMKLFKLESKKYLFYLNIHHIITDGWSMNVFYKELMYLYDGLVKGSVPALEPIKLDYVEWVNEQIEWQTTEEFKKIEDYWREELSGKLPKLNLPVDYKRPQIQSYNGSFVSFKINKDLTDSLKKISRQLNATMYMVLLAVYFIFLNKLTQDEDIIVGSPITGRDSKELENVIGLFINTLCIRVKITGASSFKEVLEEVKNKCLSVYKNGKYPFDLLVSKINPDRDLSRSPIFSTLFQYYEDIPPENDGLSMYELSLLGREENGELELRMEFNTDLFSKETIVSYSKYFETVLLEICNSCDKNIKEINLLSHETEQLLISEFTNNKPDKLPYIPVHQMFEKQVEINPDGIAVYFGDESMTYEELNKKSNRLAHFLVKHGIKPNEPVGIIMNRGIDMIVGLMGILKSGAAYLPLDPNYPIDRISYMISHSGTRILVTEGSLIEKVELTIKDDCQVASIIDMCGIQAARVQRRYNYHTYLDLMEMPHTNLDLNYDINDLMYIIYTSGSTGVPKGVMVTHSNAVNYLIWSIDDLKLSKNDRMMLVTSICFDISVFEVFGALLSGAGLVIICTDEMKDTSELIKKADEMNVTVWHSVPTLMSQTILILKTLSDITVLKSFLNIRRIMIGGEAWTIALAKEIRKFFNNAEVVNMYGPTEATIWVTSYKVQDDLERRTSIPIGKPIYNNGILILDSNKKLCGIGIAGDIYITGTNVTNGYYKDIEKTKEAFVDDIVNGKVLYKTGDEGRYLSDGNIEFLGRKDGMVKIHGYRIEVGEIESVLLASGAVKEAAVIAKKHGEENFMACFYNSNKELNPDTIRNILRQKLPEYMIPSYFLYVDEMPLTPNGKIDRKQLAQIDLNINLHQNESFESPVTSVEKLLKEIWSELLCLDSISKHDNFFSLGGNSFLVNQMHYKIEMKYPQKIKIIDIFKYPTIEKLAKYISEQDIMNRGEDQGESIKKLITDFEEGSLSIEDAVKKIGSMKV